MVERYNQRIREAGIDKLERERERARFELAYFCRNSAEQLMRRCYRDAVFLGQPLDDRLPFSYFELEDGKLYKRNVISTLAKMSLWKLILPESWYSWMEREITLREIPFEQYDSKLLLRIAKGIEKAQKSLLDNS